MSIKTHYSKKLAYHARRVGLPVLSKLLNFDRFLQGQGTCILLYHGIDTIGQTHLNGRFISAQRFEQQLDFLQTHFDLVPLSDILTNNINDKRTSVAIVFDDGYRNNLTLALPILEKRQIHATFFVTAINDTALPMLWADYLDLASYINTKDIKVKGVNYTKKSGIYRDARGISLMDRCKMNTWAFKREVYSAFQIPLNAQTARKLNIYWETLSDDEIIELDQSDFATVGLHGYYHENLGICNHDEAMALLMKSKQYMERILQRNVTHLAYPDGSYTRKLVDDAYEQGLIHQFAVDYLHPEDEFDTRIHARLTVNPFTNLAHQAWAIKHNRY